MKIQDIIDDPETHVAKGLLDIDIGPGDSAAVIATRDLLTTILSDIMSGRVVIKEGKFHICGANQASHIAFELITVENQIN